MTDTGINYPYMYLSDKFIPAAYFIVICELPAYNFQNQIRKTMHTAAVRLCRTLNRRKRRSTVSKAVLAGGRCVSGGRGQRQGVRDSGVRRGTRVAVSAGVGVEDEGGGDVKGKDVGGGRASRGWGRRREEGPLWRHPPMLELRTRAAVAGVRFSATAASSGATDEGHRRQRECGRESGWAATSGLQLAAGPVETVEWRLWGGET
uniref:Uncharacterized protein n=1 Tax=Oryza brachyantha TaxID=4533 RepID=J3M799_ORYBR